MTQDILVIDALQASERAAALLRAAPLPTPRDFVFDCARERLAIDLLLDGHPRLAQRLREGEGEDGGALLLVGGRLGRAPDGHLASSEWSGHFGAAWDEEARARFAGFMLRRGLPVRHKVWLVGQHADEVG